LMLNEEKGERRPAVLGKIIFTQVGARAIRKESE